MSHLAFSFRGFIAPVLTPFNRDSERTLNLEIIPQYANYLSEKGINGILVNGTSGEGMSMSLLERKLLTEKWANAVKYNKQHLMIQVGGAPLPDVIELAKHAESIKADSILCLPDLYFKPQNSGQLINYLKLIGKSAPSIPLFYYHIPMFTNVTIHMGQFLEVIGDKIPSFTGIKFTSSNLEEGAQALRADNNKYIVFLGSDQIMSAACAVGIDSFIATSVNMFPRLAVNIVQASKSGNILETIKKQEKLSKAVTAIAKYGHWVETMKEAMNILTNIDVGPPRAPLEPLTLEAIMSMKKDLSTFQDEI